MAAVFVALKRRRERRRQQAMGDSAEDGDASPASMQAALGGDEHAAELRSSRDLPKGLGATAASGAVGTEAAASAPAAESPDGKVRDYPEFVDGGLPFQESVYDMYNHPYIQLPVAFVIASNFVVTILEKELDPYPVANQQNAQLWKNLDMMFNILFTIELLVNFYGSYFYPFWKRGWNLFDLIVVISGWLTLAEGLPGALKNLKMLRAFRIFRLFKRIESLNKIVVALVKAIPGVFNAFMIMLIVREQPSRARARVTSRPPYLDPEPEPSPHPRARAHPASS